MGLRAFTADRWAADQAAVLAHACLADQLRTGRRVRERYEASLLSAAADQLADVDLGALAGPSILGVGVGATERGDRPLVVVDADRLHEQLPLGRTLALRDAPEVHKTLATIADQPGDELGAVVVIAVPEPRAHFGVSGQVRCLGRSGTLGALVTTATGQDAILTAGHVAALGAVARDAAARSGHVVTSLDPAAVPTMAVSADVAVIEARDWDPPAVTISGSAQAQGRDAVTLRGGVTPARNAAVVAYCTYLNWPGGAGAWADIYLTDAGISVPGDSGAPVLKAGTDRLVGHLVGGSGSVMSYVQDIATQLRAANVTLR